MSLYFKSPEYAVYPGLYTPKQKTNPQLQKKMLIKTLRIEYCLPFLTLKLFQAARPLVISFFYIGITFL